MSNSRIEVALQALGSDRFERLMHDLLEREGYTVDPTGTSGPDGGRDAFLLDGDRNGILHCSVQKDNWVGKAHDDIETAVENFDRDFEFYIFATTQDPSTTKRDRVEEELHEEWGIPTTVWDFSKIRNSLVGDRENNDLIREHLRVDPNRPFVDIESEVDDLYEDLLDRVKRRQAPDGTIVEDPALVVVHVIPQEAVDDHHDRYAGDLPHPPQFEKRDAYAVTRPKVKITENNRRFHDGTDRERYTAIHRDGWTEGIFTALYPSDNPQLRTSIDRLIANFVHTALGTFDEADIYPPYYVYVSILGAEGYTLSRPSGSNRPPSNVRPFTKDEIRLNRVQIDNPDVDVPDVMRKTFDQLWRHGGWDHSVNYQASETDDGETVYEWNPYR